MSSSTYRSILILAFALMGQLGHAIVVETTEEAADDLGYQVVGEVEFAPSEIKVPHALAQVHARDTTILCPNLDGRHGALERAHVVVMAWADREYPTVRQHAYESDHRDLAHRRAEGVAQALRARVRGELSFDLVNMATRSRHEIPLGGRASRPGSVDVKATMVDAGAAPSSALETGLFGEYAQASKAVVLIDCDRPLPTQRTALPRSVRMVEAGHLQDSKI